MAAETVAAAEESLVSLHVGDLHQDVTDGELFDAFSEYKSLTSVRVVQDSDSGRSRCYGYVNFRSTEDARLAMEAKNNLSLNGKTIRVMWSVHDSEGKNVFVKNLSDTIDNAKLQETFEKFGTVLCCKVSVDDDGKSRGYGFVQFESEDSAHAAIENLNGVSVGGKNIYVGKFMKKCDRVVSDPDAQYTNLYVKNLDLDITEEQLEAKFSAFGKILSLAISKDDQGVSKGFGFVDFDNPDDAKKAKEVMNASKLGSKILYVARAQTKVEREEFLRRQFEEIKKERILKYRDSNVFVKNISDDVKDNQLHELFSQCGTIVSTKVMRDKKGINLGFGFVCFSSHIDAIKAIDTFHGFLFHNKPLHVAIAQNKEYRQALLRMQFAQGQIPGATISPPVTPRNHPAMFHPISPVVPPIPAFHGVVPQQPAGFDAVAPQQPGFRGVTVLPSHGMQHGQRPQFNDFVYASRAALQPHRFPLINNNFMMHNWGRINGGLSYGGNRAVSYLPHMQQSNQQQAEYMPLPSGHAREMMNLNAVRSRAGNAVVASAQKASNPLNIMLDAAPPEQQKRILGKRLYPLVRQHRADMAEKITDLLLQMDNSELLGLLETSGTLIAKVEEAVKVLKI